MFAVPRNPRARFARPVSAFALGVALATAAACGSDSNTPTAPRDVSGVYSLSTVNGSSLPYTVPNTLGDTIVISSMVATLTSASAYSVVGSGTDAGEAATVLADSGTYTVSGSTVTFHSSVIIGGSFSAVAKTDTITVTLPAQVINSSASAFSFLFVKVS